MKLKIYAVVFSIITFHNLYSEKISLEKIKIENNFNDPISLRIDSGGINANYYLKPKETLSSKIKESLVQKPVNYKVYSQNNIIDEGKITIEKSFLGLGDYKITISNDGRAKKIKL